MGVKTSHERYFFFSRVNFTPSPASFRLAPMVLGRRWITTPLSFFIAVAPAPGPRGGFGAVMAIGFWPAF